MSTYDDQYFFITPPPSSPQFPTLTPDENTASRSFRFAPEPPGAPPLVFVNGWRDRRIADGIKEIAADVLFEGSNLVVRGKIREALLKVDLPNLSMSPAIFIDSKDNWHEDYWYLTFLSRLDCWDRDASSYEPVPLQMGGFDLYSVYSYSLNDAVLDPIPLEQRLMFKMGATQDGDVLCHQKIAGLFSSAKGALLTPVADF
jgi:hypothetical protein